MRYSAREILDYLHGNFAIPDNGFESAIEGLENDNDDDLTHRCRLKSNIYLSIVTIEDEEAEEPDIFDPRAAGKPNNYSFDGSEWTKHLRSGYSYGTRTATCISYSYGSQKISLNFSVIADSSLSELLYLPLEKISDSNECRFFEPD